MLSELEEIARNATMSTRWLEAGLAYASDDFSRPPTRSARSAPGRTRRSCAYVQRKRSSTAGRRAEADVQLERALAFYRSVGATAYVREAEALFAASA